MCPYISSRSSRGRVDKVPRGVGVFDAVARRLGGGSRARGSDAQSSFSLGMTEEIKQLDSVSEVCLISGKSEGG